MITLYPHQQKVVDSNPDRLLLAHDTGTGKTLTSIFLMIQKKKRALIVCPKVVKRKWLKEVNNVTNAPVLLYDRKKPTEVLTELHSVLIMTKEEFRSDYIKLPVGYPTLIVDEFHYFCKPTSAMHKSLKKYIKKHSPVYRFGLTATPRTSSAWDIYNLASLLGYDLGYKKFETKYFYKVDMEDRLVPIEKQGDHIDEMLKKDMLPFSSIVSIDEVLDSLPPQNKIYKYVDLTGEQEQEILEIVEHVPIAYWTARHLVENTHKSSRKLPYVENYIKKEGVDKFVVVCRYKDQMDLFAKYFGTSEYEVFELRGSVKDKETVVEKARISKKCIVIIQSECSEGYQLPEFDTVFFASMSFQFKDYRQMQGRFLRMDNPSSTNLIHLISGKTDTDVMKAMERKEKFSFTMYGTIVPNGTR